MVGGLKIILLCVALVSSKLQHTLCSLLPGYYQCDMDVGEMFLNIPFHHEIRPYAWVDITHVR